MKTLLRLALLGGFTLPTMLQAQVDVDRKKYPDYDAAVRPDYSMLRHVRKFPAKNAEQKKRPAVVNNAQTIHFPPSSTKMEAPAVRPRALDTCLPTS